ncbi:MAG TPA: transporter substrate-binding domain-containing protein [Paucimonas sp.]|nr:transporter substrate-binding domain-containing protein [Paucimonas sp.]
MRRRLLSLLFGTMCGLAAAAETLPAYNTYQTPPFVVEEGAGFAADVIDYLNANLKGQYQFQLIQLPRLRLNRIVTNVPDFKGVVLFLNPKFVGDLDKTKYFWTHAVMADANKVISSSARKLEYNGPESLKGLRFGGVLGHRYDGLEEMFGKDVAREDVASESLNLIKVALGRVDVTIMPHSSFRYLLKSLGADGPERGSLYISKKDHLQFDRHFFVARENAALGHTLNQVIAGMKSDPAWKAILAKYGLD